MSDKVDVDIYPIKEYTIIVKEPIVNSSLAVQGFLYLVQSFGYSPTSDVSIYQDYDIEHDTRKTMLAVRYIDVPNLNIKAPSTTSAIHLRRPGVRLGPDANR